MYRKLLQQTKLIFLSFACNIYFRKLLYKMKNIKTKFEDFINESKGGYIITGESGINKDTHYFVNDEDTVTACNKDVDKRPDDLEKEKVFFDKGSAIIFKKKLLKSWHDDSVRWYIQKQ